MKILLKSAIIAISLLAFSCSRGLDLSGIPLNQFQIPTKVYYSTLPLEIQIKGFRCEITYPHGKDLYLMKWLRREPREQFFQEIRYSEGRKNVLLVLNYSRNYTVRSCFVIWQNGDSGPRNTADAYFYDVDIGKYTDTLATNIDQNVIRQMFPDLKCAITRKTYSKIDVDFNRDFQNLDFFKSIRFTD